MTPRTLVLRFGGSSLDTPLRMRNAAGQIRELRLAGTAVAVVVGPPTHRTSRLFAWFERLRHSRLTAVAREVDRGTAGTEQVTASLLAATLAANGIEVVGMGIQEAALHGDGEFGDGILRGLDAGRIREALARGVVVILAGGHVRRQDGEIVSLGRLGADVTAVALTEALRAECRFAECHFIVDRRRLDLSRENEPLIHAQAMRRAEERGVPIQIYSFRRPSSDPG